MSRIGLIINPIAGMGGRVGLKGTDGVVEEAYARGATPIAAARAARALKRLERFRPSLTVVAAAGRMGAEIAAEQGFEVEVLPGADAGSTTAADTSQAAEELLQREPDLLLFAGGDGTARDINAVIGDRIPMLGIPTGVKMHSAVFGSTPEAAGDVAAAFLDAGSRARLREAEVVDMDEQQLREGVIATRLYGAAMVPDDRLRVQSAKAGSLPSDEQSLEAVSRRIASAMDPRRLYVVGPGTATRRVMRHLGLPATLLGIDVVRGGQLLASDVGERELLELLEGEAATLVVGVVGGQGALFGRGNQQLSPAVIRKIGPENIEIIAGLHKLLALDPPFLRVDTGDPALDQALAGYRQVHVAPERTVISKVVA